MASQTMPPRRYVSPVRSAAAAAKRERIVAAAARLLREKVNIAAFSLDAVAKAAGVARLTVYNQFGSRRGLLEAVFDERARQGGLERIAEAMAMPDTLAALDRVVEIFCDFWGSDPAIGLLHEATAIDPEFAQALAERNERRRRLVGALLRRLEPGVEEVPVAPERRGRPDLRADELCDVPNGSAPPVGEGHMHPPPGRLPRGDHSRPGYSRSAPARIASAARATPVR